MVLYAKGGEVDWHCNGVHCQAGYICFKKTSEIQHISSDYGQVHVYVFAHPESSPRAVAQQPEALFGSG